MSDTSSQKIDVGNISLNENDKEKEGLEATFEYNIQNEVSSIDLESEQTKTIGKDGKETIHDLSIQHQKCPYFKHLYKYLTQQEKPEYKTLSCTVLIEKEYYDLLDGILVHRFQTRSKKKPSEENSFFKYPFINV